MNISFQNLLQPLIPNEILIVEENTVYAGEDSVNVVEVGVDGVDWSEGDGVEDKED